MKAEQATVDSILLAEDVQRFENALDKLEQAGETLHKIAGNINPENNIDNTDKQLKDNDYN
jgi:hypothetical protein